MLPPLLLLCSGLPQAKVPAFATLGEADPSTQGGAMFCRPALSAATGIAGHVAQQVALGGGRSQLMLTKDGGQSYAAVMNVTTGGSDDDLAAPGGLGVRLPPRNGSAAAAGTFTTIAGLGAASTAVLQTWQDGTAGLKLTANKSATFRGTPPAFSSLSGPSQTVIRTANGSLLLSRFGVASDGKPLCGGGGKPCSSLAFFGSDDEGQSWGYLSRIDASAAMAAPDPRHGRGGADIEGPGQASLALLGDGRVLTAFRLGPGTVGNESTISPYYPGGNQGMNLWKAYSSDGGSSWTAPVAMLGCRGVRHDPKGIWPQLLMLSNGVLTLTTGRPNLSFWTSSVSASKTAPSAGKVADGECWSYAGVSAALPAAPYGKEYGTSGYMAVSEPEPGVLLLAYDQLPVGPVGGPGPQRVYALRANLTNHKAAVLKSDEGLAHITLKSDDRSAPLPKHVTPACTDSTTSGLPFCDSSLPRDARAWDLIGRLNLTEKVSLLNVGRAWVERLGVHSLEGNECLHGLFNRGQNIALPNGTTVPYKIDGAATIFPQSIGMGATWNRTLLHAMGDVISTEAVAKRNRHRRRGGEAQAWPFYLSCWMPVINIARDTRWGRTPETYGEDPLLTRELAIQAVRGIQGSDSRYLKVSAAPKHFTVYDGPESSQPGAPAGRMGFDAEVPPEDLDQTWLDHWKAVVEGSGEHKLGGLMCSYSALDGVPMCGNRRMLTDKLRTEWGFGGWVVSDCGAVSNIATAHHYKNSTMEAGALALTAGCDLECDSAFDSLPEAISQGLALESDVDTALYRSLIQQFAMGVFDTSPDLNPYSKIGMESVDSAAHRQLAREAAAQSAVLLANKGDVLPINVSDGRVKKIAVLGPSANDTAGYDRCWEAGGGGCLYSHIYRGYSSYVTTPLAGLEAALAGSGVEVSYHSGCEPPGVTKANGVLRSETNASVCASGIAAAAALAEQADVAIVVVGLEEHFEEEGTDRMDPATEGGGNGLFQLPGLQQQLVDAVTATKTPTVEVLINGGPLSLTPPANAAKFAILEAFYGSQACGDGIADVVLGKVSPSGKMPVTCYANAAQAGDITSMDMSKGRTYRYLQAQPTYEFGYGLSYTTWQFSSLGASPTTVHETESVEISVGVANTGTVDSAQVVQLYASLSPDFAAIPAGVSAHVPPRQLVGFEKVFVRANSHSTVNLTFTPQALAGWELWHNSSTTLHLAVGDVSPSKRTLASGSLQTTAIEVQRAGAPIKSDDADGRMNVLLILVDDLRPQLGAYGHGGLMHTPNIDRLANSSMVFDHGYTNYPYCSPSRNSFMSGRLPDSSQIWTFRNSFRNEQNWTFIHEPKRSEWTSLPQHFKKAGWWAAGAGKLYHPGSPQDEDNPLSWSVEYPEDVGGGCSCTPMANYCRLPDNTTCYDVQLTDIVVGDLHTHHDNATLSEMPFFLGLGVHKPHLPWAVPGRFFDLYPPAEEIEIAAHPDVPANMPSIAWHQCTWAAFPFWFTKGAPVNRTVAQHARRAYYAATSFADHLVGRVLDTVDELGYHESTIVMLVGDHGWQLGEHNEWGKQTVFEVATRIPYLIRDPRAKPGRTQAFAELIDIYHTLSDLAGAPTPEEGVQGTSLAPIVRQSAGVVGKTAAVTQMARCFGGKRGVNDSYTAFSKPDACTMADPRDIEWMGYSIRTADWRYTEWVAWDGVALRPTWSALNATELYAHTPSGDAGVNDFDFWENENLSGEGAHNAVMGALSKQLHAHVEGNLPKRVTTPPTPVTSSEGL